MKCPRHLRAPRWAVRRVVTSAAKRWAMPAAHLPSPSRLFGGVLPPRHRVRVALPTAHTVVAHRAAPGSVFLRQVTLLRHQAAMAPHTTASRFQVPSRSQAGELQTAEWLVAFISQARRDFQSLLEPQTVGGRVLAVCSPAPRCSVPTTSTPSKTWRRESRTMSPHPSRYLPLSASDAADHPARRGCVCISPASPMVLIPPAPAQPAARGS
mmetsp:Transcript_65513/g.154752  ORF Transcript_65513/g.154752 Transcript_65513/m.154752 type:complete len:211 (-) Transcript_65513:881-1513(-)